MGVNACKGWRGEGAEEGVESLQIDVSLTLDTHERRKARREDSVGRISDSSAGLRVLLWPMEGLSIDCPLVSPGTSNSEPALIQLLWPVSGQELTLTAWALWWMWSSSCRRLSTSEAPCSRFSWREFWVVQLHGHTLFSILPFSPLFLLCCRSARQ